MTLRAWLWIAASVTLGAVAAALLAGPRRRPAPIAEPPPIEPVIAEPPKPKRRPRRSI